MQPYPGAATHTHKEHPARSCRGQGTHLGNPHASAHVHAHTLEVFQRVLLHPAGSTVKNGSNLTGRNPPALTSWSGRSGWPAPAPTEAGPCGGSPADAWTAPGFTILSSLAVKLVENGLCAVQQCDANLQIKGMGQSTPRLD